MPATERAMSRFPVAREPGRAAAIFDLDRTLIAGYSAFAFGRDLLRDGHLDAWALQPELARWGRANANRQTDTSFDRFMAVVAGLLAGVRVERLEALGSNLFETEYRKRFFPEALALIEEHRRAGHHLLLATAATSFQAVPIASWLGIEDVVCTRFETFAGRLTGEVIVSSWGTGKADEVERFASQHRIDLSESFFYSDGFEDVPLLESVGHPCPTNPDERLAALATKRQWPTRRFEDASEPSLWELARPLLARRQRRGLRGRLEKVVDDRIRDGYRAVHWLRRGP